MDMNRDTNTNTGSNGKKNAVLRKIGKYAGRFFLVLFSFLAVMFIGAYITLRLICRGPSTAARDLFVSTILETGQMKFLASWYFSEEEILAITGRNGMIHNDSEVDPGLIAIPVTGPAEGADQQDELPDVEIVEISGHSFFAKLMIVRDPARVRLATIYPWGDSPEGKQGVPLGTLVDQEDCLAGINGGEYFSNGNWGGKPKGLVVCQGQIQYNRPLAGDVMVGFSEDNILIIKEIGGLTAKEVEKLVAEDRIRDAVSFKDIDDGDDNHFTKLIINGKATELSGSGSGANPRTVIGQRADGTVLLLVTDGRGAGGHLGATARDLIAIMQEYEAVNAANLDGGSSSSMYYDGAYEMSSVTLYYATSSWKLPTAFVVEKKED